MAQMMEDEETSSPEISFNRKEQSKTINKRKSKIRIPEASEHDEDASYFKASGGAKSGYKPNIPHLETNFEDTAAHFKRVEQQLFDEDDYLDDEESAAHKNYGGASNERREEEEIK